MTLAIEKILNIPGVNVLNCQEFEGIGLTQKVLRSLIYRTAKNAKNAKNRRVCVSPKV